MAGQEVLNSSYAGEKLCDSENDGCCSYAEPCDLGEGDCDFDWECRGVLVCGRSNCNKGAFNDNSDCCEEREYEAMTSKKLYSKVIDFLFSFQKRH